MFSYVNKMNLLGLFLFIFGIAIPEAVKVFLDNLMGITYFTITMSLLIIWCDYKFGARKGT